MDVDVAIVGAGPSGLCFASMLADTGLTVCLIEKSAEANLAHPAFDGREIALTQNSASLMRQLGLWQHVPAEAISVLRDAQVLNGPSLFAMKISHRLSSTQELGYFIANHHIRQAAYLVAKNQPHVTLLTESQVKSIVPAGTVVTLNLDNDAQIKCRLLVAADSRFSDTRRMMGVPTSMHDFGKTMMVCTMVHEKPHHHVAWEWFDYGQTLALLPMNNQQSSVVITLTAQKIAELMALSATDFAREVTSRFQHRLGNMQLISTRHAYPLVTTYPRNFVGKRFALIGDAAVGMHPVTAHGFNFGLQSAHGLAAQIRAAVKAGKDIAAVDVLLSYEKNHRAATKRLFMATHVVAKLFSDDRLPARVVRNIALRVSNMMTPFKRAIAKSLTAKI